MNNSLGFRSAPRWLPRTVLMAQCRRILRRDLRLLGYFILCLMVRPLGGAPISKPGRLTGWRTAHSRPARGPFWRGCWLARSVEAVRCLLVVVLLTAVVSCATGPLSACSEEADGALDCSRQDLSGADLSGANLSGANLYEANLSRADLSHADL